MAYTLKKHGAYWYAEFRANGKRFRFSTKESNRALAQRIADAAYLRHRDPAYRAEDSTTLAMVAAGALEALSLRGRADETVTFYSNKMRHLVRLLGPDTPMSQVTATAVDEYVQRRQGEGAAAYTVSKELVALRLILRHAKRRGEFSADPSSVLPVVATGYKPKQRYLTEDEAERLWRAITNPGAKRYVAFVFATTARHGEVMRATGLDVDINGIRVHGTKTAKSARVVPIVPMLSHWADRAFEGIKHDNWKVAAGCGSIRHVLRNACQRACLDPVSPNDLRRSVAHWLRGQGVRLEHVSAFMGHSTTRMVETVYGRLGSGELGQILSNTADNMERTDAMDRKYVPRDGIEPPTRGFSSLGNASESDSLHDSRALFGHLDQRIAELRAQHEEELEVVALFRQARTAVEARDEGAAYQALYQLGALLKDRGRR